MKKNNGFFINNFLLILGIQIPLGQLIDRKTPGLHYGLHHNEYIVYDESQVALRYLVQFRR
jgi:hypothetical protein